MANWWETSKIVPTPIEEDKEGTWWKGTTLVSPTPVRPLQEQPGAIKATGRWGEMPTDGITGDLAIRGLKQFVNILPETAKETLYGLGGGKIASFVTAGLIRKRLKKQGIDPPPLREIQKRIKQMVLKKTGIPEFEVTPPTTIGEKAVDITAGIGKFVTKLAVLKKVLPGVPEGALWEMENISSGGTPGMGYALHGAFTAPGKIIKGVKLPAKAGRLAAESVALMSVSALEQKIDTGEIDPVQIGIAAGLPFALRTPKAIKNLIRKRNPKVMKAIAEAQTKQVINVYKGKKTGKLYRDESALRMEQTKTTKPMTSKEYLESKGIKPKMPSMDATAEQIMATPQWKAEVAYKKLQKAGKVPTVTKTGTRLVSKKTGEEVLLDQAASLSAVRKVSGIDAANKVVGTWSEKAKLLNKTERKAAVHLLRQQQHARFTSKYKAERAAGIGSFEAARRAKKVRGGKAGTPEIEPLVLSNTQRELYGRRIETVYPEHKGFQRSGAFDAITKMENGRIPTNYEFGLLEPVFGTKATVKLVEALKGKKAIELVDIPMLVRDIPKALRFGFDPQAARGLSKITIRHPLIYLSTLGKNIRGIFSKKYANRVSASIEKSPVYKLGKKGYGANYLSMKPWASVEAGTKLEQYGHVSEIFLRSSNRVIRGIGRWLRASERGANLGMNSALNKLVIKGEKDLVRYSRNKNLSEESIAAWRRRRGHDINIFTKRVTAKHPKIKAIQRAANWVVFSPSYTASGLAAGPQSFIKLATGKGFADKTYAMQIMLSRIVGLTAASSMVGYTAYKWRLRNPTEEPPIDSSPNPLNPLYGKIRHEEDVYDLGFGDVAEIRLMARIGLSAYMATKEKLTGKQVTTIFGKKPPSVGESFGMFLESKRTLYLSLFKQLSTGKDFVGNPVDLKDTALDNLPFEFFQAFVEAGEADGIWEDIANGMELDATKKALGNLGPAIAALGGVGTGSYPVHAAVTRYKFQDIIAEQKHGKAWDRLTLREQNRLKSEHRKQFEVLSERVRKERVDVPFSMERIQEEEREANKRVSKMLSKESRGLVKDIDLGVSRRPKNWYLNDKRYNRYQELVAGYIDERLSKIDFTGMEDRRRVARVQVIAKIAKNRALATLRREVKR